MHALRHIRALLLSALFAAFTGCITIEENYTFKKDGSGTMEYVVDMSQIGEMLKAFEGVAKGKDKKEDGMGSLDLKDEVAALKKMPGIKKVKITDKDKFVQKVRFAFADITALNAALNVLMKDSTGREHTFFAWEGNTLVHHGNGHARDIGAGMGKDDPADTTDMTEFLSSMKYKYSFAFADPIASTVAAEGVAQENPDPRTVKLDTDFAVISRDDRALDLRIELRKP